MGKGKNRFVAHLRANLEMPAANDYFEVSINTNINPLSNQVIAIHDVKFSFKDLDTGEIGDKVGLQLLRQTKTTLVQFDDPDLIERWKYMLNAKTSGGNWLQSDNRIHFDPPEIVAQDTLIFGMEMVGQASGGNGAIDIRYTPETISDAEFVKISKF